MDLTHQRQRADDIYLMQLGQQHETEHVSFFQRQARPGCMPIKALTTSGWAVGAFVEGGLRGVAEVHDVAHPHLVTGLLAVDPAWRGLGLGAELLDAAISFAKASGRTTLQLIFPRRDWAMRKLASKVNARFDIVLDELSADISLRPESWVQLLARNGENHD